MLTDSQRHVGFPGLTSLEICAGAGARRSGWSRPGSVTRPSSNLPTTWAVMYALNWILTS